MSRIYTSADQLIGSTPLLEVKNIEAEEGLMPSPSMNPFVPMMRVRRPPHGVNASMESVAVTPPSKSIVAT